MNIDIVNNMKKIVNNIIEYFKEKNSYDTFAKRYNQLGYRFY